MKQKMMIIIILKLTLAQKVTSSNNFFVEPCSLGTTVKLPVLCQKHIIKKIERELTNYFQRIFTVI